MEKIFIIDAVNYLFRSYYAIGPMSSDKGVSTSALFGFIRTVQKLIRDFSAENVVAVFDGPDNKKARLKVFAEYKMQRKKAPEDLYAQFELAYQFCQLAGIPALSIPEVEADDTMATIALWAAKKQLQVFLCTSDKDLFQLVSPQIKVLMMHKNNLIVDKEKVQELFGVPPEQMLDFLAIVGDVSDNIPGISGFGPKTAAQLLQQFKTLEYILDNPEKTPGAKKQQTLKAERETALLSKQLATLNTQVKIPQSQEFYKIKKPDLKKLEAFYQELNLSQFLKKLKETTEQPAAKNIKDKKKSEKKNPKAKEITGDLFESAVSDKMQKPAEIVTDYVLVKTAAELKKLFAQLQKENQICIDVETTSLNPFKAQIVGIGLGAKPGKAFYLPCNLSEEKKQISNQEVLDFIKKLTAEKKISFYGHNLKYDLQVLCQAGIDLKRLAFDTMLVSYLLNPHHHRHNLDSLALEYFGKVKIPFNSLLDSKEKTLKEISIEKVSEYCCEDIDYTIRLKKLQEQKLKEKNLEKLFFEIELPLILVLARMERHGLFLDEEKISQLKIRLQEKLKVLQQEIFQDMGTEINLNSPKQLSEVLFQKLKLPMPGRKKTAFSTGALVLEKLAQKYPIAQKILDFRTVQKLLTTYIEALPKQIDPQTKRIHPSFNQSVTATGRLSCTSPNLQNIPIRSEEGLAIRKAFVPQKPGWSFLSADYSQIELRLLAHFSKDPELLSTFQQGKDIHSHTAALIFKVPIADITKQMRSIAKTVNFGILYGQGPYGLKEQLNISYQEAAAFIENYFQKYKHVKAYLEKSKQQALDKKETATLFGRIRPIMEIDSPNLHLRSAAERLAVNTPLQGTAADLIKIAMIEIDKAIEKKQLQGFSVLQIHDELVFEVPDNEIETFKEIVKNKMENAAQLCVPLIVHMGVGKNWSEC